MRLQRETLSQVWDELVELARRHHEEQAVRWPFKPKRQVYEALEHAGALWLFTMRAEDRMLGYQAFLMMEHPHLDLRMAYQDTIYVLPVARGFSAGKFLIWVDSQLWAAGAQKIVRLVPECESLGLDQAGYKLDGRFFSLE